jgi:hypothetical protein
MNTMHYIELMLRAWLYLSAICTGLLCLNALKDIAFPWLASSRAMGLRFMATIAGGWAAILIILLIIERAGI